MYTMHVQLVDDACALRGHVACHASEYELQSTCHVDPHDMTCHVHVRVILHDK